MARRITAFLVGLLVTASLAGAQERFGSLTGTVTDTTKAAVPGATVTATNKETGAQRVAVSDADGTLSRSRSRAGPVLAQRRTARLSESRR